MQKELKLEIIDGTFDAEETKSMLTRIFHNEMQFHDIEKFSKQIRFGIEDKTHDAKCEELSAMINRVKLISEAAQANKSKITVKGIFEIKICDA